MRRRSMALVFVGAILLDAVPLVAHANGRFPDAQQLIESPVDPDHVVVQATFGLVTSFDGGATWGWTCEGSVGYGGDVDPPIAIAAQGVTFAAVFDGLARSTTDGCGWAFVGEPIGDRFVIDVSARRSDPSDVVAVSTNGLGGNLFDTRFFRSRDGGATFVEPGDPLPEDVLAETLDVAPSDPDRVYVTGLRILGQGTFVGVFGRSDDGGETFTLRDVEGSDASSGLFLAAVDPVDADVLYVRRSGAGGRLLRSEDGGATFTVIAEVEGRMEGFALSPDGSQIALGGTLDPMRIGPSTGGGFEVVGAEVRPRCLTWTERGIYACGSETGEGFTVGLSVDGGVGFEPIFSRLCLEGPLPCPSDSAVGSRCPDDWVAARPAIGADQCTTATSGAGGGDSTSSTPVTSSATAGGADDAEPPAAPPPGGGCCSVATGSRRGASGPEVLVAIVGVVVCLVSRRRR